MGAQKHVLLAMTGGAIVFTAGGGQINTLIGKVNPNKPASTDRATIVAYSLAGWGAMFLILVFVSDIEPIAPLATGFAWLIFMAVLFQYGEDAARNVLKLFAGAPSNASSTPATPTHGGLQE